MTDAGLDRIESTLSLKLPAFYRRFMLDYPRHLAEEQPDWSDLEKWELTDDPDRVIHFNQYVRAAEPGEYFDNRAWPAHYFVIGSEQEQNWYFLDLASGSEAVYLFHHEVGEVHGVTDSLAGFPEYLRDWWHDVEQWG